MRSFRSLFGCIVLAGLAGLSWAWAADQQSATRPAASDKAAKASTGDGAKADADKPSAGEVAAQAEAELIGRAAKRFAEAYNKHDPKALASAFTPDGELIDEDGAVTRGRDALTASFAEVFKTFPEVSVDIDVDSIDMLGTNLAFQEGYITSKAAADDPASTTRFVALHVKKDGQWLILRARDFADESPPSNYDRLRELEWMIGDWADESQGALVLSSCRWVDDNNYLLQEFQMRVGGELSMSGSMRIGWDPLSEQIKSWVFDSQGGYSDGLWTRLDDKSWLVVSRGVTRDREISTSNMVCRVIDADTATWESNSRVVGGERQDDVPSVVVKRRAPPPSP